MRVGAGLLILALAACSGQPDVPPASETAESRPPSAESVAHPSAVPMTPDGPGVPVRLRAVDLNGAPVSNVFPIATTQANAFDPPVAQGELTGDDGRSVLVLRPGIHAYVRMWDPTMRQFANNFLDVVSRPDLASQELTVTMVPGAAVTLDLLLPDGMPAARIEAEAMLLHPKHGPWWPVQAVTDEAGVLDLGTVPAGRFGIEVAVEHVGFGALPAMYLPPGEAIRVGPVQLTGPRPEEPE